MTSDRLIDAGTPEEAWLSAIELLLAAPGHRVPNLIVRIAGPVDRDATLHKRIMQELDAHEVRIVARTIMPSSIVTSTNWEAASQRLLRKLDHRSYFRRMVDYKDDGGSVNQIANAVGVLRRRGVDPIPIVLDRPGDRAAAHIGFPCLSLIQFHKQRPSLNCSAVYRSHYYHDKAYGNFLGLARLHQLVARECGLNVGELTVLSTQAQLKELAHMTAVLRAAS